MLTALIVLIVSSKLCLNSHRTVVHNSSFPPMAFDFFRSMVVVLSDYESIFGAMVRQSETFADRGSAWIEDTVINHERRGYNIH